MSEDALVDVTFNSCPDNLQRVRELVKLRALEQGCSETLVQQIILAVDEACANIIRHGYHGDRRGSIRLVLCREGDHLAFRLRDHAATVDPACVVPRDLEECKPGGLGLNFIDSVMDEWAFERPLEGKGNVLLMSKKIL